MSDMIPEACRELYSRCLKTEEGTPEYIALRDELKFKMFGVGSGNKGFGEPKE